MEEKIDLAQILASHSGERHLVVLHDFPDADAISSGYAHKLISAQFGIDVDIVFSGKISHHQNMALVNVLGNSLDRYREDLDLGRYQAAILVDHQGTTVDEIITKLEEAQVPVLLIIDHHQPQERVKAEFNFIKAVGATATIYSDFLEQGVIELDNAHTDHVLVTTALMHGILSDTQGFIRATPADLKAAAFLSRYRDAELLSQIVNQARSKHTMDIIHRALGNRKIIENYSVAGIGYVRSEDRDTIPQAADFLQTEENVHTAIVYGIVENGEKSEVLVGSLRTSKLTLDPDHFIKDVFGKDGEGNYFGGGRPMAGGFSIPIGFLSSGPDGEYKTQKWEVYDSQIKHRIFDKIGVKPGSAEG